MNIIVVGCGKIGTTVLEELVAEGHNVTAVDSRPAPLADVTNIHDVMTVCGNGGDCETLEEAGVAKADLVVACTGSDEVNMLCCYLAKEMGAKGICDRAEAELANARNQEETAFLQSVCHGMQTLRRMALRFAEQAETMRTTEQEESCRENLAAIARGSRVICAL